MIVNLAMVLATIAFLHQNFMVNVSLLAVVEAGWDLTFVQFRWRQMIRIPFRAPHNHLTVYHWQRDEKPPKENKAIRRAQEEIHSLRTMVEQLQHPTAVPDKRHKRQNAKGTKTNGRVRDPILL